MIGYLVAAAGGAIIADALRPPSRIERHYRTIVEAPPVTPAEPTPEQREEWRRESLAHEALINRQVGELLLGRDLIAERDIHNLPPSIQAEIKLFGAYCHSRMGWVVPPKYQGVYIKENP